MKIAVGFDRRGTRLRAAVIGELMAEGHEVLDLGGNVKTADPDYACKTREVADAVLSGRVERGVVVTVSGVGASFVANKIDGIHAGACSDTYTATLGAEYGMNVLSLGAAILSRAEAAEIVRSFVRTRSPQRITSAWHPGERSAGAPRAASPA